MDGDLQALEDMMDSWMARNERPVVANDPDLSSYVVSKVSGRPLALPPVHSMVNGRGSRKVFGYQEPRTVLRKPREKRNLDAVRREVIAQRKQPWSADISSGIPSLPSAPPRRHTGQPAQRKDQNRKSIVLPDIVRSVKTADAVKRPAGVSRSLIVARPDEELRLCQAENEGLLDKLATARARRNHLTKRVASTTSSIAQTLSSNSDLKKQLQRIDSAVKKLSLKSLAQSKTLSSLRQKEKQLKELRHMLRVTQQRLQHMVSEDESLEAPVVLLASDGASAETKLRADQKSQESRRREYDELVARRNDVLTEINRVSLRGRERVKTATELSSRLEREKQLARLELERRSAQELQKEITRIRENHEKVLRHRTREAQQRDAEYTDRQRLREGKFENIASTNDDQSKELVQVRIAVATSKGQLDNSANELRGVDKELQHLKMDLQVAEARSAETKVTIKNVGLELKVLREKPKNDLQPIEAARAKERAHMSTIAGTVSQQVKDELRVIAGIDDEADSITIPQPVHVGASANVELLKFKLEKLASQVSSRKAEVHGLSAGLESRSLQQDAKIESLTKELADKKRRNTSANVENTKLLETLDLYERLCAMNGIIK